MTTYVANTTNATNTLSYTTEDASSVVTVTLNGAVETSSTLSWIPDSDNTLEIEVVNGSDTTTYTVTITHTT